MAMHRPGHVPNVDIEPLPFVALPIIANMAMRRPRRRSPQTTLIAMIAAWLGVLISRCVIGARLVVELALDESLGLVVGVVEP